MTIQERRTGLFLSSVCVLAAVVAWLAWASVDNQPDISAPQVSAPDVSAPVDGAQNDDFDGAPVDGATNTSPPPLVAEIDELDGAELALIAGSQGNRPGFLVPQAEPHGGTITRITDVPGNKVRHQYSSTQAFNADESVIFLQLGRKFFDTSTMTELKGWRGAPGLSHWSTVDPDIMLFTPGGNIGLWNPSTGTVEKTITLPGYTEADFQTRTSPSVGGDKVGVKAKGADGSWYGLAVNLETGAIDTAISFDDFGFSPGGLSEDKARRATASPSGDYLVLSGYADGEYNKSFVFDWSTGALIHETLDNDGVECPGGHGDLALDADGRDVFVGICKGGGASWSRPYWGKTVVLDLATGVLTPLPNVPGVDISHYSGRALHRPGWAYGSSYGPEGRIVAFKLDGSRVEDYADPQNPGDVKYYAETQAVPSPSGLRVLYSSSWNGTDTNGMMYLLDLSALNS